MRIDTSTKKGRIQHYVLHCEEGESVSVLQMAHLVDTSESYARRVLNELVEFGLAVRNGNRYWRKVAPVETLVNNHEAMQLVSNMIRFESQVKPSHFDEIFGRVYGAHLWSKYANTYERNLIDWLRHLDTGNYEKAVEAIATWPK